MWVIERPFPSDRLQSENSRFVDRRYAEEFSGTYGGATRLHFYFNIHNL
jgi:hypothetical protein